MYDEQYQLQFRNLFRISIWFSFQMSSYKKVWIGSLESIVFNRSTPWIASLWWRFLPHVNNTYNVYIVNIEAYTLQWADKGSKRWLFVWTFYCPLHCEHLNMNQRRLDFRYQLVVCFHSNHPPVISCWHKVSFCKSHERIELYLFVICKLNKVIIRFSYCCQ